MSVDRHEFRHADRVEPSLPATYAAQEIQAFWTHLPPEARQEAEDRALSHWPVLRWLDAICGTCLVFGLPVVAFGLGDFVDSPFRMFIIPAGILAGLAAYGAIHTLICRRAVPRYLHAIGGRFNTCPACSYDLWGTKFNTCPECGCPIQIGMREGRKSGARSLGP